MKDSTVFTANVDDEQAAKAYRLFTETAVEIFDEFKSSYIDVKGDGVFALFTRSQPHRALAATISFKTFVHKYFTPKISAETGYEIGGHFGIDQANVLVRRLGLRRSKTRTDRQNEVWAGQPINMAAKLAGSSRGNELWVSDRFFNRLRLEEFDPSLQQWKVEDVSMNQRFSFKSAYIFYGNWSELDGALHCDQITKLDNPSVIERLLLPAYALIDFWKRKMQ
jgi:class 3 adenylate cyclase